MFCSHKDYATLPHIVDDYDKQPGKPTCFSRWMKGWKNNHLLAMYWYSASSYGIIYI